MPHAKIQEAPRVPWDHYFIDIARQVATRATCKRGKVGAVITSSDRTILATGYNGSIPGDHHCLDVGCDMEGGHCVRTVHAEANAVAQAAKNGARIAGAVLYCTHLPCWPCYKLLANAGVCRIVYLTAYRPDEHVLSATRMVLDPFTYPKAAE